MKILDVGSGFHSRCKIDFPDDEVTTLDIDPDAQADVVADAIAIPLDGATFDMVFASHILEHFGRNDLHKVLLEWRRVLKPGGELRIFVPSLRAIVKRVYERKVVDWFIHAQIYGGQNSEWDTHKSGFFGPDLRYLLEAWGYDVVTIEDQTFPMPMLFGGRCLGIQQDSVELKCIATKTQAWTPYRVLRDGKEIIT